MTRLTGPESLLNSRSNDLGKAKKVLIDRVEFAKNVISLSKAVIPKKFKCEDQ
jgi:hypothetical protein